MIKLPMDQGKESSLIRNLSGVLALQSYCLTPVVRFSILDVSLAEMFVLSGRPDSSPTALTSMITLPR